MRGNRPLISQAAHMCSWTKGRVCMQIITQIWYTRAPAAGKGGVGKSGCAQRSSARPIGKIRGLHEQQGTQAQRLRMCQQGCSSRKQKNAHTNPANREGFDPLMASPAPRYGCHSRWHGRW